MRFAPFDTPRFSKNIRQKDLDNFQNLNMLKNNIDIVTEIKDKFVFYNSDEMESKKIHRDWIKS